MSSEVRIQSKKNCLEFTLRAVPATLQVTGGREIPFKRAILSMRNTGLAAIVRYTPHATLAQEGGSVQDITDALTHIAMVASLPPGDSVEWDLYDLLLAAHPGVASKVHLWGYKAILNWWIDVAVWAEYASSEDAAMHQTPLSRWKVRWSPGQSASEEIDLSIEDVG
jgi:hypothetical protein